MAPSKRNHEAWTNNEPQPQTNHGIEEDQQVDVVMDVDATKPPNKLSLLTYPITKQWIHPTTIPLNSNNLQQTKKLLLSTTNQILPTMGGDGAEIAPTMCHNQVSMMAGVASPLPAKTTCLH